MPKTFHIERLGVHFAVFDDAGNQCSGKLPREIAHSRAEILRRQQGNHERRCITCGGNFISEGPGNRMCVICLADAADQVAEYSIAL